MSGAFSQASGVEFIGVRGAFEDGWCEPQLHLTVRATAPIRQCSLVVWLKPEPHRTEAQLRVRVNGHDALECRMPYDTPAIATFACLAEVEEVININFDCDNEVMSKGSDLRSLSFHLSSIHFS